MDNDAGVIPSSPSAETSSSSSDIDTESTGSFFRDRSTTLGTLMGVSLADGEERAEATRETGEEERERPRAPVPEEGWRWRRRWRSRRGASWWRMCRDDVGRPTSLGYFLDLERQLSGAGLLCGAGGEEREATAPLFENGQVLPSRRRRRRSGRRGGGGSCGGRPRGRYRWPGCRCCSPASVAAELDD